MNLDLSGMSWNQTSPLNESDGRLMLHFDLKVKWRRKRFIQPGGLVCRIYCDVPTGALDVPSDI